MSKKFITLFVLLWKAKKIINEAKEQFTRIVQASPTLDHFLGKHNTSSLVRQSEGN